MAATLLKSSWSSGNLQFLQKSASGDGAVHFGKDDVGVDVKLFGATSGKAMLWDQSADILVMSQVPIQFKAAMGTTALFDLNGAASYLFDFGATTYGGLVATADGMSQDPETASEDAYIAVLVGASIYEIPCYLRT
jgi:hypothetical protein